MALAWQQLIKEPKRWAWGTLLAAELGLLYAHNTGPVVALWINIVTLLVWLRRRRLKQPDWRGWLAGQGMVLLLWLPWLLGPYRAVQGANSAVISGPNVSLPGLSAIWQGFWTGPWEMLGLEGRLALFALAAFVLALLLIPWRRVGWWLLHVFLLTAGLILGLTLIGNPLHGRYLVMIVPLLLAALGAGIARLKWPLLRWGIVGFFAALLLNNIVTAQNPAYQHDQARQMVQYYADALDADATRAGLVLRRPLRSGLLLGSAGGESAARDPARRRGPGRCDAAAADQRHGGGQ